MYSAYKLNKQDDNIQPWRTRFPIWNQSVVPCPVLTVASWSSPKSNMPEVLTGRGKFGHGDKQGIRLSEDRGKAWNDVPIAGIAGNHQKMEEARKDSSLEGIWSWQLWLWTSSLQYFERIPFCCFKAPSLGTLLQQFQEMNTLTVQDVCWMFRVSPMGPAIGRGCGKILLSGKWCWLTAERGTLGMKRVLLSLRRGACKLWQVTGDAEQVTAWIQGAQASLCKGKVLIKHTRRAKFFLNFSRRKWSFRGSLAFQEIRSVFTKWEI